jgi:hypothetical protein
MREPIKCTLLELVYALNEVTENDREVVAAAIFLVNSGRVQLCGNFANAKIVYARPPRRFGRQDNSLSTVATLQYVPETHQWLSDSKERKRKDDKNREPLYQ